MVEVDITDTALTVDQLLVEVERGNEVTLVRQGQPIARLSPVSQRRQSLASRRMLRARQLQSSTSSLETLENLRHEARY